MKKSNIVMVVFLLTVMIFLATSQASPLLIYGVGNHTLETLRMLGLSYDFRDPANPVTVDDLANHEVLIVGSLYPSYASGLSPAVLESISGNVILTGHDVDYHAWYGEVAAQKFFTQAIDFASAGSGIGLFSISDLDGGFFYLPTNYNVGSTSQIGDDIALITADGLASELYDGLSAADMSGWGASYHICFTNWNGTLLTPWEYSNGGHVITLGYISVPEPIYTAWILSLAIGVLWVGRKIFGKNDSVSSSAIF